MNVPVEPDQHEEEQWKGGIPGNPQIQIGAIHQFKRRERRGDLRKPSRLAIWTDWVTVQESDVERSETYTETYSFDRSGKYVMWKIRVKDRHGNWSGTYYRRLSWGVKPVFWPPPHIMIDRYMLQ